MHLAHLSSAWNTICRRVELVFFIISFLLVFYGLFALLCKNKRGVFGTFRQVVCKNVTIKLQSRATLAGGVTLAGREREGE